MKKLIFSALLVMLLATAASAQDIDGALNVTSDVNAVLSQNHDRNVMLIFDQESCVYCDLFKQNVLSDKAVQNELNDSYVVTIVDINKYPDVAARFNVFGTPSCVVLDSNGKEIYRLEGYVESDEFLSDLKEI